MTKSARRIAFNLKFSIKIYFFGGVYIYIVYFILYVDISCNSETVNLKYTAVPIIGNNIQIIQNKHRCCHIKYIEETHT